MNKYLRNELKGVVTIDELSLRILELFKKLKDFQRFKNVGYVSGIISSEGEDKVEINRKKLGKFTSLIAKSKKIPIFSVVDVLPDEIYYNLDVIKLPITKRESRLRDFWKDILKSGFVTDLFLTPRWEISEGAKHEYQVAKKSKIKIHFVNDAIVPVDHVDIKRINLKIKF